MRDHLDTTVSCHKRVVVMKGGTKSPEERRPQDLTLDSVVGLSGASELFLINVNAGAPS